MALYCGRSTPETIILTLWPGIYWSRSSPKILLSYTACFELSNGRVWHKLYNASLSVPPIGPTPLLQQTRREITLHVTPLSLPHSRHLSPCEFEMTKCLNTGVSCRCECDRSSSGASACSVSAEPHGWPPTLSPVSRHSRSRDILTVNAY